MALDIGAVEESLHARGSYEEATGEVTLARQTYEELLGLFIASNAEPEADLGHAERMSRVYVSLTALYRHSGETVRAESMERRTQELWRHWDRKLPNNPFVRRQLAQAGG
jgi:hypothetical protein